MLTHTFAPDPILQQDVQCFWTFEQDHVDQHHGPILPDAHVELIFNLGGSHILETTSGEHITLPPIALNGLQKKPLHFRLKGDCQFVAVRFNAWAMRHFVELPNNFHNLAAIPLIGLWKGFAQSLEAALRRSGYEEAVACLQQFIFDIRHPYLPVAPIRAAGELLDASRGNVGLNELAQLSNLSPRQFERQFQYGTGVSPKTYARLIRHETVRNTLSHDPGANMVMLAQDLGYSDQAHFIHDFKAFTTYTPGQFVSGIRASSPA